MLAAGSLEPNGTGAPATAANRSHADPLAAQLVNEGFLGLDSFEFTSEPGLDSPPRTDPGASAIAGFTAAPFSYRLRESIRHVSMFTPAPATLDVVMAAELMNCMNLVISTDCALAANMMSLLYICILVARK